MKKYYENTAHIIAARLAEVDEKTSPDVEKAMRLVALEFADFYAKDNSKFDRKRFLTACGIHEKRCLIPCEICGYEEAEARRKIKRKR